MIVFFSEYRFDYSNQVYKKCNDIGIMTDKIVTVEFMPEREEYVKILLDNGDDIITTYKELRAVFDIMVAREEVLKQGM